MAKIEIIQGKEKRAVPENDGDLPKLMKDLNLPNEDVYYPKSDK